MIATQTAETRSLVDAEDIVAAMPSEVYRSLPFALQTAQSCARVVENALRYRNPRAIRSWLQHERATPASSDLIACLDIALARAARNSPEKQREFLTFEVRSEALDYLQKTAEKQSAPQLDPSVRTIANAVLTTIGAFDARLVEHSEAVAALSVRLARAAGLDAATIDRIEIAATVHEIGRLSASRDLLDRPTEISEIERRQIRLAMTKGALSLRHHAALATLTPIVTGMFDDALDANDLLIETHILSIADAFLSMTEPRAYRRSHSPNEAIKLISRSRRFSPELVQIFTEMLDDRQRLRRTA